MAQTGSVRKAKRKGGGNLLGCYNCVPWTDMGDSARNNENFGT